MNTEKIKELIENSDMLKIQKNHALGFINRIEKDEAQKTEVLHLIQQITNEKNIVEVLYSSDEVKIYSVYTIHGKDEWVVKFPIRSIYLDKNGVWKKSCTVSPNFDVAFLDYLEKKYLGNNSQFMSFAIKMLEMKIE